MTRFPRTVEQKGHLTRIVMDGRQQEQHSNGATTASCHKKLHNYFILNLSGIFT